MSRMITLQLKDLLAERDQSLYWLWQITGIRYATLLKMQNGEAKRLELTNLEKICRALHCEPGDLFNMTTKPRPKK